MITGKDKNNKAAHAQLARDRACLYLRHGYTVSQTARELGKSRAFVYDARSKGGRDAVPLPVVTGDPLLNEAERAALIDQPFEGLDTVEKLGRECLRLYAMVELKAAEGDRVAAFVQDSMVDNLAHLEAYMERTGRQK